MVLRSQILLLLSAAIWGVSFIFTKGLFLTEPHITTTIIVTGRLLIATAVFIPMLALTHRLEPIRKGDLLMFLILSFFEPFLYSLLETGGVKMVSASLASVIVATIPLFTPFGMALAYKERLRPLTIVGAILSLVGIVIMMMRPDMTISGNPKGVLMLAGAVVIAVCYTLVLVRVLRHYQPVTITAYQNLISLIYFIPIVLFLDRDALPLLSFSTAMWGRIAFLGVFCSTMAYVCFNYGIRIVGATAASVYNNLIPVFSFVVAVTIGQEELSLPKVVGMVVVIAGLFLAQRKLELRGSHPSDTK